MVGDWARDDYTEWLASICTDSADKESEGDTDNPTECACGKSCDFWDIVLEVCFLE